MRAGSVGSAVGAGAGRPRGARWAALALALRSCLEGLGGQPLCRSLPFCFGCQTKPHLASHRFLFYRFFRLHLLPPTPAWPLFFFFSLQCGCCVLLSFHLFTAVLWQWFLFLCSSVQRNKSEKCQESTD